MDRESFSVPRASDAETERAEMEAAMEPRGSSFEGPQIFTREQFGKESGTWLKKLNQAQSMLMEEINRRAYHKGEDVSVLETQAALIKDWSDRVWNLSLENAHQGLTDPDGVMSINQDLLRIVEDDPMKAAEAVLAEAAFPAQLEESARGLKAGISERRARKDREMQMSRELAGMREAMDTLEEQMSTLRKLQTELTTEEDRLIESGDFSAEKLTAIGIEREEIKNLSDKFFVKMNGLMLNFDKLLAHFEKFQRENPFATPS